MQVVVDTSVIGRASESLEDLQLLCAVLEGQHDVAMDYQGKMAKEYHRYLDFNGVVGEWYKVVSQRLVCLSGELGKGEIEMLEGVGGDDDDYPFIGVAMRTNSGLLFHYDRGYDKGAGIREVLAELGVRPYRPAEALAESLL